jgi:glyoxylase-like metal-dependent hydrolase (beta-lactamase superfamily II)
MFVATTAFAQANFSTVEVKAMKVAGSVYMLTGAGGNIGVSVGDDGIVVIDDQYAPLAPKIEAALKTITDKPVRFIINTHWHPDHTGGNEYFGRTASVISHENARKRLAAGAKPAQIEPASKGSLPVLTFDQSLTVHLNGEDVRAMHFPHGHTDGDAIIFFTRSNVVHMGDDFFNGNFPFVDLNSGGSVSGLIENVERVLRTLPDDVKIIPGHGPLGDKTSLRAYIDVVKAARAAVEKGVKAGKSVEQLKADKVLEPWAKWASSFVTVDLFTETLYRDVTANK